MNRIATLVTSQFNARQDGQLISAELLQFFDSHDINGVVIRDRDDPDVVSQQTINNLPIGNAPVFVIVRARRVKMQIPAVPKRTSGVVGGTHLIQS